MTLVIGMTTLRSGFALRVTVTDCVAPSATVYDVCPNVTVTAGSSSSPMLSVVSVLVPAVTRSGRLDPNPSFTLSSSSSSVSSVAMKAMVFSVSPSLKVTLAGTE